MPKRSAPRYDAPVTPVTIPRDVKTLVIFGGSFDPPHRYHSEEPSILLSRLYGDAGWLLYVPAAKSPLKGHGPIVSDARRIAMLKLSLKGLARCSVWTDEIDRARWQKKHAIDSPSFTVDTLVRLRSIVPAGVGLRLLIGADQAASFHRWRQCRRIIRLAEPLVMPRGKVTTGRLLGRAVSPEFWTSIERAAWAKRLAPMKEIPVSSTSLRDLIPAAPAAAAQWKRTPGLKSISPAVARYIISHQLYGFGSTARAS